MREQRTGVTKTTYDGVAGGMWRRIRLGAGREKAGISRERRREGEGEEGKKRRKKYYSYWIHFPGQMTKIALYLLYTAKGRGGGFCGNLPASI